MTLHIVPSMLFLWSYNYLFSCVCGLCHHLQPDLILDNFPDLLVEAWSYFFFLTNVDVIH